MKLHELVRWLDAYLDTAGTPDSERAFNGLQVDNGNADVRRIAVAVDSGQAVIERAVQAKADLLIVHHGLLWGGTEPLTGRAWKRYSTLIDNRLAVYSSHLPLDRHPDVGNNAVLARLLGMTVAGMWGRYKGTDIGVLGAIDLSLAELVSRVSALLGCAPRVLAHGPPRVSKLGIVTGSGGDLIGEAAASGIDTLLTGEGKHHSYFDAEELGVNVIYAGHYATETLGVKALAEHLAVTFGLAWEFIDHPTGL